MQSEDRSVVGALLGELDDQTRRRFGLKIEGEQGKAETREHHGRARHRPTKGSPLNLSMSGLIKVVKRTVGQISEDRVPAVAAGVTFFGLLSLFPAITAFVSIYGLAADPATISQHMEILERFMPEGALGIVRAQVEAIAATPTNALSLAGIMGLLIAFYSANGGMKALLTGLNVAFFQKETRGFFKLNLVAMAFTVGGLLLLTVLLVSIAVIPAILRWLPVASASEQGIALLRWPLMFCILVFALAAIYRWGPSRRVTHWRWISPGAVFAAIALVAVSVLFSWYAANFANYNETYGSLGAVVGLMMWLWLSAMVVLVGAELNSEVERQMRLRQGLPVENAG